MNRYIYQADGNYLIETFDGNIIEPFKTEDKPKKTVKKSSKKTVKKSSNKPVKKSSNKPVRKSSNKPVRKSSKKTVKKPSNCRVVKGGCDRTNNHIGYIWGGWDEVGAPAGIGSHEINKLERIGGCDGCKSGCDANEYMSGLAINKCKNGASYEMSFDCCKLNK
jgi:hypothetical protein